MFWFWHLFRILIPFVFVIGNDVFLLIFFMTFSITTLNPDTMKIPFHYAYILRNSHIGVFLCVFCSFSFSIILLARACASKNAIANASCSAKVE